MISSNDKEIIIKKVCEVFNIEENEISSLESIAGGLTNKGFKFCIDNKWYFIRVPNSGANEVINRSKENHVYSLISNLDIVENIIYINEYDGIKISELIDRQSLTENEIGENIEIIASAIKKYHANNLLLGEEFSPFKELEKYEELCLKNNVTFYDDYQRVKNALLIRFESIKDSQKISLCHNDFVCGNIIIDSNNDVKLIDWEYAGDNDVAFEIASLFSENNLVNEQKEKFYKIYDDNSISERVEFWTDFQNLLWSVWHLYIMSVRPDYEDKLYGLNRFKKINI